MMVSFLCDNWSLSEARILSGAADFKGLFIRHLAIKSL